MAITSTKPDNGDQIQKPLQQQSAPQPHVHVQNTLASSAHRGIRRHAQGGTLTEFTQLAKEIIASKDMSNSMTVIGVDQAVHGFHYSIVLVTMFGQFGSQRDAAYYAFILEGSNTSPKPMYAKVGPSEVEIQVTAMDAWDDKVAAAATHLVSQQLQIEQPLVAGCSVVGRDVDINDRDALTDLLWTAQEANLAALTIRYPNEFEAFNIKDIINPQHQRVTASFSYKPETVTSLVGKPLRSNISMTMAIANNNQNQNTHMGQFMHSQGSNLMEANGYVDLIYSPAQQSGQVPPGQYGYQYPTQVFVPRLVLTRIISMGNAPYNPETFMLALAAYSVLTSDFAWASSFLPQNSDDLHDVGAIGYRAKHLFPDGKTDKIDTRSNDFGPEALFQFLSETVDPNIFPVSLDCEAAGPESWITDAFLGAAKGNVDAHNYLIDRADRLTNGNFSRRFSQSADQQIAYVEQNDIHLGTYLDDKGRPRDLREIDTLAVMNLMGDNNDILSIDNWDDTHNNQSVPLPIRLEKRHKMLRDMTTSNMKIHGFAERISFTPGFLSALIQAIQDAGFRMSPEGLLPLYGSNVQSGNTLVRQHAGSYGASGMLHQGAQHSTGPARNNFSRW